jgi:hypothetical protein
MEGLSTKTLKLTSHKIGKVLSLFILPNPQLQTILRSKINEFDFTTPSEKQKNKNYMNEHEIVKDLEKLISRPKDKYLNRGEYHHVLKTLSSMFSTNIVIQDDNTQILFHPDIKTSQSSLVLTYNKKLRTLAPVEKLRTLAPVLKSETSSGPTSTSLTVTIPPTSTSFGFSIPPSDTTTTATSASIPPAATATSASFPPTDTTTTTTTTNDFGEEMVNNLGYANEMFSRLYPVDSNVLNETHNLLDDLLFDAPTKPLNKDASPAASKSNTPATKIKTERNSKIVTKKEKLDSTFPLTKQGTSSNLAPTKSPHSLISPNLAPTKSPHSPISTIDMPLIQDFMLSSSSSSSSDSSSSSSCSSSTPSFVEEPCPNRLRKGRGGKGLLSN